MFEYKREHMPDDSRYTWERYGGDQPPTARDSKFINRNEGFEILDIINRAMKLADWANISIARSLEKKIHDSTERNREKMLMILKNVAITARMARILNLTRTSR